MERRIGDEILIFSGNSNPILAQEICQHLEIPLGRAKVEYFNDKEINLQVMENARNRHAIVIQSTSFPPNDHLMELLLFVDALKRASAKTITAVIPYYGYARQDRKTESRVPISAKVVADLLAAVGTNRVVTMELHSGQIQGFFNIPVDNLYMMPIIQPLLESMFENNLCIVSPDAGGVPRARALAKRLKDAGIALIDKRRPKPGEAEVMNVIGSVEGKTAIILDDMADTAGTLTQAAAALKKMGAKKIIACCTHAVLSGPAVKRIEDSAIEKLIVSNTIPLKEDAARCKKIQQFSVAGLIAEAIKRVHSGQSISSLFE